MSSITCVVAQVNKQLLGFLPMDDQVRLGNRVRERRRTLQITQERLATALGVTPQHISLIEQDKGSPSLTILPNLAAELGVSVDFLLTGKEGLVSDVIPTIKADKSLNLKAKRALIALVEELRSHRK
jgi:transcriptional regulator with XRE-family HTH domain